jgi:adenine phosphoribosyltransferase
LHIWATDLTSNLLPLFSSLSAMLTQEPNAAQSASTSNIKDNATRLESQPTPSAASASELASTKISLRAALRQFPDFPIPGIDFVDILPLFASHSLHTSLIRALELQVLLFNNGVKPDVIVGLDARGFLFGPSLALRLGASFAPVRKRGKLPGPTKEAAFEKEYGQDFFQIQSDAIAKGQKVLVVDDIIATGKQERRPARLI